MNLWTLRPRVFSYLCFESNAKKTDFTHKWYVFGAIEVTSLYIAVAF